MVKEVAVVVEEEVGGTTTTMEMKTVEMVTEKVDAILITMTTRVIASNLEATEARVSVAVEVAVAVVAVEVVAEVKDGMTLMTTVIMVVMTSVVSTILERTTTVVEKMEK